MWNNTPPSKEHEYDAMEKDCGDMTSFRRPPYYMIQKEVKANEKAQSRIKAGKTKQTEIEKNRKEKTWETKNFAKEPKR